MKILELENEELTKVNERLLNSNLELRRENLELKDKIKDKNNWIFIFLTFNILAVILLYLKNV